MKYPYKILEKNNNNTTVEMKLSSNMDFFNGHFDSQAIMPAVAQLYIVEMLAKELLNIKGKFSSMRRVKFVAPIFPNTLVVISISYDSQKGQINYSFSENGNIKSKGNLIYRHD